MRTLILLIALLFPATAQAESDRDETWSLTVEPLFFAFSTAALNNPGTVVELQYAAQQEVTFLLETGYFASSNYRNQQGEDTGLETQLFLFNVGFVWWLRGAPFRGPFFSARGEFWWAEAIDEAGTAARGIAIDGNVQLGWSFVFGRGWTLQPGLTLGMASTVTSPDSTVEYPIQGVALVPHLRLGWTW